MSFSNTRSTTGDAVEGHVWTVKPGMELHGGSSLPTSLCCERCGVSYTLYQLSTEPGQTAANQPCSGKRLRGDRP